eukprot:TCALIF_08498-PA protein Name:"Protein of unknown function" AED:0.33 eAED:0.33 QI:19/0.5/0.71/0.85/0.5/0.57/7/0/191
MVFAQNLIIFFTLLFSFVVTIEQVSGRANKSSLHSVGFHRQKKLFSLFNIVQFQNDPCQALAALRTSGTCLSAQECSSQGGTMDGNCASGFGVCCIFTVTGCGGTVTRDNCMSKNHITIPSRVVETVTSATAATQDVTERNLPFVVNVRTLPNEVGRDNAFSGFSLDYKQIPYLSPLPPHARTQEDFYFEV